MLRVVLAFNQIVISHFIFNRFVCGTMTNITYSAAILTTLKRLYRGERCTRVLDLLAFAKRP